jgi:FkbH-like protein
MNETVVGDCARARVPIPVEIAAAFTDLMRRLRARSAIVWGEHCSECDYPACFTTCAFYAPRADLKCRRFTGGIEPLAEQPPGVRLHRIRFRKWGKLEGRGPVTLRPAADTRRAELLDVAASTALTKAPLPYAIRRSLARNWNQRKIERAMAGSGVEAEAFVIEVWSVDKRTHPFTVTILQQGEGAGMFQAPFSATPAYGRLVVPVAAITAQVDLGRPFLVQIEPVAHAEGRDVVFGLCDFAAFEGDVLASVQPGTGTASAVPAEKAKVVIWDLDETLWTGSLAEDGPAGVTPRPEAVAAVKALDERGVLQSIASKNDAGEALAALQAFGLADYFLHPQIAWTPKSDSVRRVAAALDLGIESFVFIDDQPFERGEVQAAHPGLRVMPPTAVPTLLAQPCLDLPVTTESRRRRALYRTEETREAAFAQTGTDYLAFLRGCAVTLDVAPLLPADLDRVYELSQRTNQLNFTGVKLSRDAVRTLLTGDPGCACLTLRCTDRFGEYGLIGFAVLDLAAGEVAEFFLSCRVQRKRVEHAFFALAAQRVRKAGFETIRVRFRRTERNGKAAEMLRDLRFEEDGDGLWSRPTAAPFVDTDVVRVREADPPRHAI